MGSIRGKSIVLLELGNKFLFTVCAEETTNKKFYIPVGGGIEFGEHSDEAAKREVMEEIGEEIKDLRLLDIIENIFTYNGINEHEIVFIYIADLKNKDAYHSLVANKNDKGESIKLTWASVEDIKSKSINVYPFQLLKLLVKDQQIKKSPEAWGDNKS